MYDGSFLNCDVKIYVHAFACPVCVLKYVFNFKTFYCHRNDNDTLQWHSVQNILVLNYKYGIDINKYTVLVFFSVCHV